jgi:hypothetical protein
MQTECDEWPYSHRCIALMSPKWVVHPGASPPRSCAMAQEMSDSHLMAFAVVVWLSILALMLFVLRLVRGRPFFKSSKNRRFSESVDRR